MVAVANINLRFNVIMQSYSVISSMIKLAMASKALPSVEITLCCYTMTQIIITTTVVEEVKV